MLGQIESLALFSKKYNQGENSKLGCSPPITEVSKVKIKPFGKPVIPSHPTLTSKNLQERKWTLLGSGIGMKITNSTWLNISVLSGTVFK